MVARLCAALAAMFLDATALSDCNRATINSALSASAAWAAAGYSSWSSFTCHTFADRAELLTGVDAWVADPTAAAATYGDISLWDTSLVTHFNFLFCGNTDPNYAQYGCSAAKASFNGDISAWDTSSVTTLFGVRAANTRLCPCHDQVCGACV